MIARASSAGAPPIAATLAATRRPVKSGYAERVQTEHIAIFPLSNVVLFPGVNTPLHLFEPRYRQMAAEVIAGDGRVVYRQTDLPIFRRTAVELEQVIAEYLA